MTTSDLDIPKRRQIIVSHSEVESRLLCERRHWYGYAEKLQRNELSTSLNRGITGHAALAEFFMTLKKTGLWSTALDALDHFWALKIAEPGVDIKMLAHLMQLVVGFLHHYKSTIETWTVIDVEKEYRIPIISAENYDLVYAFTVDMIVWVNGAYAPIDWKFTYDFYSASMVRLLPQLPKYIGALRHLGMNVRGGYYGYVRYRSINSTLPQDLYKLDPVTPTDARIERTFQEYLSVAKKIAILKEVDRSLWLESTVRTANTLICKSCSFVDLCGIELDGNDGLLFREKNFVESTYGYKELTE